METAIKRNASGRISCHFRVEATGALAHRSHASAPFHKLSPYSSRFRTKSCMVIPTIIGKFLKNGGLCRPTIASGLVAIKVIWFAIRQRPFDLRIRVAAIAFYKRSVGKYYKMCPCRRSEMKSKTAHETTKSAIIYNG